MPVIFFRSIERALGSPDNILIGADFGWDIGRKYKFYSQFILDEFRASELFGGHQWWANKWGLQTGVHAFRSEERRVGKECRSGRGEGRSRRKRVERGKVSDIRKVR